MKFRSIIIISLCFIFQLQLFSQKQLISKDSAIHIAIASGIETGLQEFQANLKRDTVWEVISLLCDDYSISNYDIRYVNAINGKVITEKFLKIMPHFRREPVKIDKTNINSHFKLDTLKVVNQVSLTKLTDEIMNVSNPQFSPNDKLIVFEYDLDKIAVIASDNTGLKEVCDSCHSPQWISNEWILYLKNDRCVYKKNALTGVEIQLSNKPFLSNDYKISPDARWIAYTSRESYSKIDLFTKQWAYSTFKGEGLNLCLLSVDGKSRKYITKIWKNINHPVWTANSDTILFYIEDQKYFATGFSGDSIHYYKYKLLPNVNLWDYEKAVNGVFPYRSNCQVLQVILNKLVPAKVLVNETGRYANLQFSHNLKYFVYSKTDVQHNIVGTWIKEIK